MIKRKTKTGNRTNEKQRLKFTTVPPFEVKAVRFKKPKAAKVMRAAYEVMSTRGVSLRARAGEL